MATTVGGAPHHMTMVTPPESLEAQLQRASQVHRVRISELFHDYDPLRSSYITWDQFHRCLNAQLGLELKPEDVNALCARYAHPTLPNMVNYRDFYTHLETAFDPTLLDGKPQDQITAFRNTVTADSLGLPDGLKITNDILTRCYDYYKYHGINVKSCYADFDRHHRGYVTEAQFHRSFPGPSDVTPEEVTLLAQRYRDPTTGLCSYIQFHSDIVGLSPHTSSVTFNTQSFQTGEVGGDNDCSIEEVLRIIKTAVSKRRVRVLEFIKDFDKLRSGRVLKTLFRRALDMCGFDLTQAHLLCLEQRYESPTDSSYVDYLEFSDEIESIFTTKHLEKAPLLEVTQYVPPPELSLNLLTESEESVVQETLHRIAEKVRVRGVQLKPLFSDYDKVNNGCVSQSQFHRVLSVLKLDSLINSSQLGLLCRKFDTKVGGWSSVNYAAFCAVCDEYSLSKWPQPFYP